MIDIIYLDFIPPISLGQISLACKIVYSRHLSAVQPLDHKLFELEGFSDIPTYHFPDELNHGLIYLSGLIGGSKSLMWKL